MDCSLPVEMQGTHPAQASKLHRVRRGGGKYFSNDWPTSRLQSVVHHTFRWRMLPVLLVAALAIAALF